MQSLLDITFMNHTTACTPFCNQAIRRRLRAPKHIKSLETQLQIVRSSHPKTSNLTMRLEFMTTTDHAHSMIVDYDLNTQHCTMRQLFRWKHTHGALVVAVGATKHRASVCVTDVPRFAYTTLHNTACNKDPTTFLSYIRTTFTI